MATPLFANLSSLIGLNREHGIDVNPTLLRVLTDLYVQRRTHPPDDERQYVEMILSLIDRVDAETAATVAAKLRAYGGLPAALQQKLGEHVVEAAPAPLAPPQDLAMAEPSPELDPAEHFLTATPEQRRRILAALDETGAASINPPPDAPAAVRALETAALSGRPVDFIREIERSLALPRIAAQRIVNDPSGEPTIVIAKALGMPIEVLQRILLFVNPSVGQSVRRVFDLSALYDEFSRESALKLVALWREMRAPAHAAGPAPRHAIPGAREAATPSARPAPLAPLAQLPLSRQRTT